MANINSLTGRNVVILIEADENRNGLAAIQAKNTSNSNMWNITKVSKSGRTNGLVYRYNSFNQKLIVDGISWRKYVSYDHISHSDLLEICTKKIG